MATLAHNSRRAFFFSALEGENDGPRVAEDAMESGQWRESGEPVQIAKLSCGWHRFIVTRFQGQEKRKIPGKYQAQARFRGDFYPLQDAKSLLTIMDLRLRMVKMWDAQW